MIDVQQHKRNGTQWFFCSHNLWSLNSLWLHFTCRSCLKKRVCEGVGFLQKFLWWKTSKHFCFMMSFLQKMVLSFPPHFCLSGPMEVVCDFVLIFVYSPLLFLPCFLLLSSHSCVLRITVDVHQVHWVLWPVWSNAIQALSIFLILFCCFYERNVGTWYGFVLFHLFYLSCDYYIATGQSQLNEWLPVYCSQEEDTKSRKLSCRKQKKLRPVHPFCFSKARGLLKRPSVAMGSHVWLVGDHVDAFIQDGWELFITLGLTTGRSCLMPIFPSCNKHASLTAPTQSPLNM